MHVSALENPKISRVCLLSHSTYGHCAPLEPGGQKGEMDGFGKIYWVGIHTRHLLDGRKLGSPLGKIHSEGIRVLEQLGWRRVGCDTAEVPIFAFTTRKGANFPAQGENLPKIRQLPHKCSSVLDDKRSIWLAMQKHGFQDCMPKTYTDLNDFRKESGNSRIYFLKHVHGVKGQSVHVHFGLEALLGHMEKIRPKNRKHFIIQEEVEPLLIDGRKFVIRSHVLLTACPQRRAYLHEDSIVLQHASVYDPECEKKATHVSQYGKNPPKPTLLREWPEMWSNVQPQLEAIVWKSVQAAIEDLVPGAADPNACLYHLFGYDSMVDVDSNVRLLEVNAYPAIGNGSMRFVDKAVFTRLIEDLVSTVVIPVTDGLDVKPGGFIRVDMW